jgi:hypothetical protein
LEVFGSEALEDGGGFEEVAEVGVGICWGRWGEASGNACCLFELGSEAGGGEEFCFGCLEVMSYASSHPSFCC